MEGISQKLTNERIYDVHRNVCEDRFQKSEGLRSVTPDPTKRVTFYPNITSQILINTPDSEEVKYLRENCPKLMKFINLMGAMLDQNFSEKQN